MLLLAALAVAGGSQAIESTRTSVASGGGVVAGGAYRLTTTIGSPDAAPLQPATGGAYSLVGGFLVPMNAPGPSGDALFGNGFE